MNNHIKALLVVAVSLASIGLLSIGLVFLSIHPHIGFYVILPVLAITISIVIYISVLDSCD